MFRQYRLQDFRLRLVVLVYAITILGILVIGSAAEEYQSQQLLGMILGTVAMLVLTLMDYRILLNLSWVLYAVNIILLLAVKFVGYEANGAKRWLNLGFMRFQPSELTKLILIIFFAYFFTKYKADPTGTGHCAATSVSDHYHCLSVLCIVLCGGFKL